MGDLSHKNDEEMPKIRLHESSTNTVSLAPCLRQTPHNVRENALQRAFSIFGYRTSYSLVLLPNTNNLSFCRGKNMVTAFLKKIGKKTKEGAYDHVLHAFAILSAIPPLCFLTADLNRYLENSTLHHVQHRPSLVFDAVGLAFVLLTILWDLLYLTIPRDSQMPSRILVVMDFVLSWSTTSIGESIISNRTAVGKCFAPLGECTTSARGLMQGAGGLMILSS
jgi:hypothetical protein